jgi:hypothetical protein
MSTARTVLPSMGTDPNPVRDLTSDFAEGGALGLLAEMVEAGCGAKVTVSRDSVTSTVR